MEYLEKFITGLKSAAEYLAVLAKNFVEGGYFDKAIQLFADMTKWLIDYINGANV